MRFRMLNSYFVHVSTSKFIFRNYYTMTVVWHSSVAYLWDYVIRITLFFPENNVQNKSFSNLFSSLPANCCQRCWKTIMTKLNEFGEKNVQKIGRKSSTWSKAFHLFVNLYVITWSQFQISYFVLLHWSSHLRWHTKQIE